ncbi:MULTISPECIES: hypothetical protein [Salinibaculum]|uniref:hypothetical protein n=1 Tax=Salinibaculum TaxID=2732368 RepID=UPI0030CCE46E
MEENPNPSSDLGAPPGTADSDSELTLSDEEGYVGDTLTISGRNLEPGREYEIVWHSSEGRWGIVEGNEVIGPQFKPRQEGIATVEADDSGAFDEEWTVQEDYGGPHTVQIMTQSGRALDQATYHITPWFELDRTEAPLGDFFTVTGYGLGPRATKNNYQVTWDNGYVGFMTGVLKHGTAMARIRAVGPPGEHTLQVWRNYQGIPYLSNNTQSPFGPVAGGRTSAWTVEVTEPEEPPEIAWTEDVYDESPIDLHYPDLDEDTEAELEITPQSGPPGTSTFITGENFPPNEEVDLIWYRHVGAGIRGPDILPEPRPDVLPTATTDDNGRFQVEVEIPTTQGSTRPIVAEVDGKSVAVTGFMVKPKIETFEPRSGPVGTEIEIELSGVGWTSYENSPYFIYDNKAFGYAAESADAESDTVRIVIRASGEPGWHFIDVVPSITAMKEDEPEFERKPHLSYLHNHPMRVLPGMHMAFEITEE